MHRCADIFRRNENVRLTRLFRGEKPIADWMDRQFAGYEVSLSRQDVPVLPDSRDLASAFEVAQRSAQRDSCPAAHAKFFGDLDLVQRPVIFPGQQRENLFSNLRSSFTQSFWAKQ